MKLKVLDQNTAPPCALVSPLLIEDVLSIRQAAQNKEKISGLTHEYYRYPARFSPRFVSEVIECLSQPGEIVLDPFMGGGTSVLEAHYRGRIGIGTDVNSLAVFVAKSKVTMLSEPERQEVRHWMSDVVPTISYKSDIDDYAEFICDVRTKNLHIPQARPIKKLLALALASIETVQSSNAKEFIRAMLLNVAQWALNAPRDTPSFGAVKQKIVQVGEKMLAAQRRLDDYVFSRGLKKYKPILLQSSAENLPNLNPFAQGAKASLVVTSPPYPGIHILYHRWQVDGRKETPAPYWIAGCFDGKGTAHYNFADRGREKEDAYFEAAMRALSSVRHAMADGAPIVQLIAFSNPQRHLKRYLAVMREAGFAEIREALTETGIKRFGRIWRNVPQRAWHAANQGSTNSSREVVLIHQAI